MMFVLGIWKIDVPYFDEFHAYKSLFSTNVYNTLID